MHMHSDKIFENQSDYRINEFDAFEVNPFLWNQQ